MYIFEAYATVETVFHLRDSSRCATVSLSVDNEAACAAPEKGAAKSRVVLMPVSRLWPVAARNDIAIWIERAPSKLNPADSPPKEQGFLYGTELEKELPPLEDIRSFRDLPRTLPHSE